jgi:hypothetical protein
MVPPESPVPAVMLVTVPPPPGVAGAGELVREGVPEVSAVFPAALFAVEENESL